MAIETNGSKRASVDSVIKWLAIASFAAVALILTLGLWIVATGIMDPPAPRSFYEKQIELLEEVVKEKPKVAAAWGDWARALIVAKQYSAAERVIERGEKVVGTKTPELNLERARLALARGDHDEALKLAEQTLKVTTAFREKELKALEEKAIFPDPRVVRGPVMAEAAAMKGDLLAAKKRWDEALKAYSIAVYEEPESADYLVKRGSVYIETGDEKKARADFERALTFIPDFEPALTGLKRLEKGTSK